MEQVYYALTETLIPWIEDRFGVLAAWAATAALIALPIAGIVAIVLWI
ncbi:hypothetical protein FHR20_000368 [Sphingomonas leidyi]|uniref:Uncharacterized protein n=1 Tax=Sphingomonas leidyi TaxID=68569 RepID=A0A7X5UXF0_9SPHN|nr:hypothetical protein [Sphingomonas leidyi]NIJ63437.1 hypothetical protein [Sphingomonas leidyi]